MNVVEISKEKQSELDCIKDVNVCSNFKQKLLKREETFYGIKRRYIGYIAMGLSLIGFIPIIYNVYKTRKTNNFTYGTIFLSFFISGLWFFYGWHEESIVTIIRSAIFVIVYSFILYVKLVSGT